MPKDTHAVQSDRELVDAVIAGDKAPFADLVRRYEPLVRAAVVAIVHDQHLAQDVAQDAFLAAYRKLHSLRDRSRFGPWILKIARREAYRSSRRKNRLEKTVSTSCGDALSIAQSNGRLDHDSQEVLDAVARLPGHEQVVIVLRYFEAQSVETISTMTGRPIGTITKQLSRARARLQNWLKETT